MIKYEVVIYWSDEDGAFIAQVPELPGCMAHGVTQEAALGNAQDAIRLRIDTAKEFGDPITEAKGRFARSAEHGAGREGLACFQGAQGHQRL